MIAAPRAWPGLVALGLVALVPACERTASGGPPEIRYGMDTCDRCRMVIDDPRFAAALRTRDGEVRRYDDIGDLLADLGESGVESGEAWVHDYAGGAWLRASEAFLARSDLPTPMGSGLAAFAERAAAAALIAQRGGQLLEWSALAGGREVPEHDDQRTP